MADNVAITAGSGTSIATDDVGGVQFQKMKLDVGGDGLTVPVVGSMPVSGDVANATTDSGAPVKVGGKANAVAPSPVASGQRVDAWNDTYGRRVVSDFDPELALATGITSYRERIVSPRYTILSDSIADGMATFWTQTNANGGSTVVSAGEGSVQSGTSATGSAQVSSTIPAYLPGQSAWLLSAARFGDTGSVGNTRRLGAFTVSGIVPQDGFYFELASDSTLNAVTVKAGTATSVASTSWSRVGISPFTLDVNYHLWEIRWTANRADFYIDSVLRHSATVTNSAITSTLNFPMTLQSISTSGSTNRALVVRNIGLGRFGTRDEAPFSPDVTMQASAAATSNGTVMNCIGYGTAAMQVTGTFVGTITFEGTLDGTNYVAIAAIQEGASAVSTTATAPGIYRLAVAGLHNTRARVSSYTSGTISVVGRTTNVSFMPKPVQTDQLRTRVTIAFQNVAPATADTLLTLTKYSNGVAGTPSTSIGVTAGKTLRITAMQFGIRAGAAAIAFGTLTIRSNSAGATVIGSPSEIRLDSGVTTATANSSASVDIAIPEGMEFSGTQTIGASLIAQATTNIISVSFIGYEY